MITDIIYEIANVILTLLIFTIISIIVYKVAKFDMSNFRLDDGEYDEDN